MKFSNLCPMFCLLFVSLLSALEVGGHISTDTVWSPDNNPYLVMEHIYVDAGRTLTILPGTEVLFLARPYVWPPYENMQYFWYDNPDGVTAMFVYGTLVSEGEPGNLIRFGRMNDGDYYAWGTIWFWESAPQCKFRYCRFEWAGRMSYEIGLTGIGAILSMVRDPFVEYCEFYNCTGAVNYFAPGTIYFHKNQFDNRELIEDLFGDYWIIRNTPDDENSKLFIAGNSFVTIGEIRLNVGSLHFIDNQIESSYRILELRNQDSPYYIYGNRFTSGGVNYTSSTSATGDIIYFRDNEFVDCDPAIELLSVEGIVDRCNFVNSEVNYGFPILPTGHLKNSTFENSFLHGRPESVVGNLFHHSDFYVSAAANTMITNNVFFGNEYDFLCFQTNSLYANNIFWDNESVCRDFTSGDSVYMYNNLIDFELPWQCIDMGGNIVADPLLSWQDGIFSLLPGSPCIDAGATDVQVLAADLYNRLRVWDGDNDGTPRIDIGPVEYGAPGQGGIRGYTLMNNGIDPVDYVLLKIRGIPEEFTFSDSLGYFEFHLPPGVYTVDAERVFYNDATMSGIEVLPGELTDLTVFLSPGGSAVEEGLVPRPSGLVCANYPNPFNPETTIKYEIAKPGKVKIDVFNIKGQKVRSLVDHITEPGYHSVVWNGKDDAGRMVSSGVFFYRISTSDKTLTKKMLLLR